MITGDNPLTAVHVAREVEIVDREALILDLAENPRHDEGAIHFASSPFLGTNIIHKLSDLVWRTVDEHKVIPVNPAQPLDLSLFDEYDICITGAAMKHFENRPSWNDLVQNTWVYARVSPSQKEYILTSLKTLGYVTLMAGDGTNDVGALKQAHIGVALLDGTKEDLEKIAERQRLERIKKVYESQLSITARFGQPPPPVPPAIAHLIPEAVEAQKKAAENQAVARRQNPMEKVCSLTLSESQPQLTLYFWQFDLTSITEKMSEMEGEEDVPKIKLGDASCAAPFTSKLSNVSSSQYTQDHDSSPPAHIHYFLLFIQSPTLSDKVAAHWSPPSRCTKFWLSTASSPHTVSVSSIWTASSSETIK